MLISLAQVDNACVIIYLLRDVNVLQDGPTKCGRLKGFILKKHLTDVVKDLVSRFDTRQGVSFLRSPGVKVVEVVLKTTVINCLWRNGTDITLSLMYMGIILHKSIREKGSVFPSPKFGVGMPVTGSPIKKGMTWKY